MYHRRKITQKTGLYWFAYNSVYLHCIIQCQRKLIARLRDKYLEKNDSKFCLPKQKKRNVLTVTYMKKLKLDNKTAK